MLAEGATVRAPDAAVLVSGSKPESRAPRSLDPLAVEWAQRTEKLIAGLEVAVEQARAGIRSTSRSDHGRDRRIARDYEGHVPTFVAFVEGVTEKHVRNVRARASRDAVTGSKAPIRDPKEMAA